VLDHVLQVGDQRAVTAGGDGGLMHVQGTGEAGSDPSEFKVAVGAPELLTLLSHQGEQFCLTAGDGRTICHDRTRFTARPASMLATDNP
jgi:hypothetical protein